MQHGLQLKHEVASDAAKDAYEDAGVAVDQDEAAYEDEDVESHVDDGDDVVLEEVQGVLHLTYLCRTWILIPRNRFFT